MKLFIRAFVTILLLGLVSAVLNPTVGCGLAWVTMQVQAVDGTTHEPIRGATVTLNSEHRLKDPEWWHLPEMTLTAQTGDNGKAILKDMFGAGFGNFRTSINVGTSTVRCEAEGYAPTEVRAVPKGRLQLYNFLIYKQPSKVYLSLALARQ